MRAVDRGQRVKLGEVVDAGAAFEVSVAVVAPFALDTACFGVDAAGKLAGDPYMVFFNQLATPCGGARLRLDGGTARFALDLGRLPATVQRLVFTVAVEGDAVLRSVGSGAVRLEQGGAERARYAFTGGDFGDEKALLLAEVYRHDGGWRFAALGQGFNGGLAALLRHFGGEVAEGGTAAPATPAAAPAAARAVPAAAAPAPPAPTISLTKQVRLEKELSASAPKLVSLVKAAGVTLAKKGLADHQAKVCLVLDVSGSMAGLYSRGVMQQVVERVLAMACLFDDDKAIDTFLFDDRVIAAGEINVGNYDGVVKKLVAKHKLGAGTDYAPAMRAVLDFYAKRRGNLPVYVLFVTDGAAGDEAASKKVTREASKLPFFWQFVGVGGGRFSFLEKLDDLDGRFLDNADFFALPDPSKMSDADLYARLVNEYPGWLAAARAKGLI